ncbi:pentatricopeptide repeat-containing protein At1g20230-like [Wolffia australiana]
MAHGLALHGRPRAALRLIRRIPRPDAAAFYAALKACHVSCLAAPARALFLRIRDPRPEHVVLFAGALARAGQLAEAAALAAAHRHLRVEILRAVIDGCRIAGDLQLGRSTAEQLLELDPLSADNYVLLGNAYAAQGRWKMVEKMREMARDLGLKPSKACSWIELKGKVHVFAVGDVAHPRSQRIRWEARRLMAAPVGGSDPETGDGLAGFALHDVDEERECVVGGHSEILAVVFGVLSTPETALVRVTKNARLSRPCHSAIKRISEAAGREVLLRDPLRFHHFRHGECSCGDVW